MKSVALLLVTAMAFPAFAKKTVTITVDDAVSHKAINVNFDGSITVTEPRLSVEGQKLKVFGTSNGFYELTVNTTQQEMADIAANGSKKYFPTKQSGFLGLCRVYGKAIVVDATVKYEFWGKESRAEITEHGLLRNVEHNIGEGIGYSSWISSITCR